MHLPAKSDVDQEEATCFDSCCPISDPCGAVSLASRPPGFIGWLLGPWPIALIFALCSFLLTTRNNDYPYYYEKDAYSKVAQVVSGHRNFFHPLLMVNSADAVLRITGMERTPQNAVMAGRWSIASFSAIAIGALVILAYRLEGWAAGACVGTLLTLHPLYFELAHFFKEDPALIVGLALSFLAMHVFWNQRTPGNAAFLGAAAAIAISGKYVGIAALIMGVIVLICAHRNGNQAFQNVRKIQKIHWGAFLAAYFAVLCTINHQLVFNIDQFSEGFGTEMSDLTREDKIGSIPHFAQTWKVLTKMISATLAFLAITQIIRHIRHHRQDPVRWLLFLYPIIFANILVWSPRLFTRHFLPVVTFLVVLAGLAIPLVAAWILRITRKPQLLHIPLSALITLFIYQQDLKTPFRQHYKSFKKLTRETLIAKINKHVPEDAVIAADARVYLVDREGNPRLTHPVERKVIARKRLYDFGSLEELRRLGVTHVAAHGIDSRVLFKGKSSDLDEEEEEERPKKNKRSSRFYRDLEKHSKLIWEIKAKGNTYVTPHLRFYELIPEKKH